MGFWFFCLFAVLSITLGGKSYLWQILIWLDQGANVIFSPLLNVLLKPENGGFGSADETLSSVFGKNRDNCKACFWLCLVLHRLDKNHCAKSIELDEQAP